jgi:phosphoserine phosphatase
MFVATLIAAPATAGLDASSILIARRALAQLGATLHGDFDLGPQAHDIRFDGMTPRQARNELLAALKDHPVDVVVQAEATRAKRLYIADMDSTMITVECIDELADFVGKKREVAAITEAAMRGELEFEGALDARVALLEGLPEATLQACYDERVAPNLTPGAATLIATLKAKGVRTVLVSGGFTFFTSRIRERLGFDVDIANVLETRDGRLTGKVIKPIVNAAVKQRTLEAELADLGATAEAAVAIGDGANDILMIQAAGLGLAYHAKPKTQAAADAHFAHADLTGVLYALGLAPKAWVSAA